MRIFSYAFIFLLLISSVGCKQPVQDKYTDQLDSAITVIEAAQEAAMAISKEKLEAMDPVYQAYNEFFTNEYDDMTDTAFYFNQLRDLLDCTKYVGRSLNGIEGWREELAITLKQLQDLKHDYENGLLPIEDVQTYLNNELFAVYQINQSIQKNVGMASACIRKYNTLTSVLDSARMDWLSKQSADE